MINTLGTLRCTVSDDRDLNLIVVNYNLLNCIYPYEIPKAAAVNGICFHRGCLILRSINNKLACRAVCNILYYIRLLLVYKQMTRVPENIYRMVAKNNNK